METSAKLYSLNYSNVRTYLFALLFVVGNIALPQICHLVPYGGPTLLPIYFFTLIAAYKYGFRVGLLTAILSPVINHLLCNAIGSCTPHYIDKIRFTCRYFRLGCTNTEIRFFMGYSRCRSLLSDYRNCF